MYDPDLEVNVHELSDADLVRFAADCMRPTPDEHSVVSSRLYGIASKVGTEDQVARAAARRSKFEVVK